MGSAAIKKVKIHNKRRARLSAPFLVSPLGRFLSLVAIALAFLPAAMADMPSAPPSLRTYVSPHGNINALSDPVTGTDFVETASGKVLWHMPHWYQNLHVLDDGEHWAIAWGGYNLIPLDAPDSFPMISFWERDRKMRTVTLKEIVPDRSILQRTASHYQWGNFSGIDEKNRLVVIRNDKQVFYFDMVTGSASSPDESNRADPKPEVLSLPSSR